MVTYGFYNSINHDRVYDATQMSEIFDGIIRDGVYQYVGNKFLVDKDGLDGFQIRVGTGRAWFNHTWTKNDAPLILTLPAPPTLDNYYRADAIVIDINANVNVRENKIIYVTGTEVADNPSPPYPELLDGEHKQVALAYIVRKGAETEINAANINYVVGSNPCPYVTAPVQAVDLSAHVAKWQAAWEQWFQGPNGYVQTQKRAFDAEIENATDDVNENVAEFRVWMASQKSQFNVWMDDSKNDFDSWFANLQYILDGDVAGHLQNEIEALDNRVTPIEKGGTGNNHGHIQTGHDDSVAEKGEFSTAEGINVVSAGKCSHAEGSGPYTYSYRDAHLKFDGEYYKYNGDFDSTSYNPIYYTCPSISSGASTHKIGIIRVANYDATVNTNYAGGFGSADPIKSVYFAFVLTDETDHKVLKQEVMRLDPSKTATYANNKCYCFTTPDYIDNIEPIIIYGEPVEGDYKKGEAYWYMDGDTPSTSNIYVKGIFACTTSSTGSTIVTEKGYTDIVLNPNETFNEDITIRADDQGHIYSDTDFVQIVTNEFNTHTYSFKCYYSYTKASEGFGVEHKIIAVPAGNALDRIGYPTEALGDYSHAEGRSTVAEKESAHSEGTNTTASGIASHAEGDGTKAIGYASHAAGFETEANGDYSYAGGYHAKSYDIAQFIYGYNGLIPSSGVSKEIKEICTSLFSLSLKTRHNISSKDETANLNSLIDANAIADKNRGGLTVSLKCGTAKNSISYKTLMPNDTFGTFLEFIDLIEGDPYSNISANSIRVLKLCPNGTGSSSSSNCGLYNIASICGSNSASSVVTIGAGKNISIGGTNYKYPIIEIKNSIDNAVSTNDLNVYIKYVLIRLF